MVKIWYNYYSKEMVELGKMIYSKIKKADKSLNRILIPKKIVDKFGSDFLMEVYEDGTIILKPMKG
jgi:hypothetical protein